MLPLGRIGIRAERGDDRHSRLTPDEQRTLLTLWVMARSPLMVGGDLPTSDPATLALLANPAVGHVLRAATDGREILREPLDDGELIVWTARRRARPPTSRAFWTGPEPRTVSLPARRRWSATPPRRDTGPPATCGRPGTTPDLHPTAWEPEGALVLDVPSHGVRWTAARRLARPNQETS